MRPIPPALRKQLAASQFMQQCCFKGCGHKEVEWNHALFYAGQQINEWYAIVPLCDYHHRGNNGTIWQDVRDYCERLAIEQGLEHLQIHYPKSNWKQRYDYLKKYEK